jgi:hypothetical protein
MPGTIEIEMRFEAEGDDPTRFEQFLDDVVDEFAKLGVDVDYTAVVSELKATWSIDVPDASESSLIDALTTLRTALAAVGVETELGRRHEVMSTRNLALA